MQFGWCHMVRPVGLLESLNSNRLKRAFDGPRIDSSLESGYGAGGLKIVLYPKQLHWFPGERAEVILHSVGVCSHSDDGYPIQ